MLAWVDPAVLSESNSAIVDWAEQAAIWAGVPALDPGNVAITMLADVPGWPNAVSEPTIGPPEEDPATVQDSSWDHWGVSEEGPERPSGTPDAYRDTWASEAGDEEPPAPHPTN